jgi:hypothetical protein
MTCCACHTLPPCVCLQGTLDSKGRLEELRKEARAQFQLVGHYYEQHHRAAGIVVGARCLQYCSSNYSGQDKKQKLGSLAPLSCAGEAD